MQLAKTLNRTAAPCGPRQSLIAYHHADRAAAAEQQANRRLADFVHDVPIKPIAAVRASRGTSRLSWWAPPRHHTPTA
jgi:hypothetical protein